jgi:hypothetical protein
MKNLSILLMGAVLFLNGACGIKIKGDQKHTGKVDVGVSEDLSKVIDSLRNGISNGIDDLKGVFDNIAAGIDTVLGSTAHTAYSHQYQVSDSLQVTLRDAGSDFFLDLPTGQGSVRLDLENLQLDTSLGLFDMVRNYSAGTRLHWIFENAQGESIEVELNPDLAAQVIRGQLTVRFSE